MALATGLTVAGVLLLICALAALPSAIYWLPEALTEGGSYWTWLVEDSMPMLMSLTGGIGCLFGANHIRTTRRMCKKINNIVGDAKYMYIQDIADAIPMQLCKMLQASGNCIDEGLSARRLSGYAPQMPCRQGAPARADARPGPRAEAAEG